VTCARSEGNLASAAAATRPAWGVRILALLAYLGLAPVIWALPARQRDSFLGRQCAQSLVLFLTLGIITVVNAVLFLIASYLLVFHRVFYETQPVERVIFDIMGVLLLLWLVAWLIGVVKALCGSMGGIPYLTRLRHKPAAVYLGVAAVLAFYALIATLATAVAQARSLSEHRPQPAQAYMLFDDIGWVPHWVFELGFSRVAKAARAQWGEESVVVTPFTLEALDIALAHGTFVFLSSHGTEQGLYTQERWFTPEDAEALGRGSNLQYVYITGCDSGLQARGWEAALAPAQVQTFNRLSAVAEHVYWLWFRGPGVIRDLR
jgi:uncharacterized Tic20 family protein